MEITVVFSEPEQIKNLVRNKKHYYKLLDEGSIKTRRKAFQAKHAISARLTPVVIIKDHHKYLKVFYREEFQDPIDEFNNWLNNGSKN